jgi:hypothetical protein
MITIEDKYNKLESDYDDLLKKREEEDQQEQEGGKSSSDEKKMFEILEREVFGVVAKIKAKNAEIAKLTTAAEEHKVREMALKRELKKIVSEVLSTALLLLQ